MKLFEPTQIYTFNFPTPIHFGAKSRLRLGPHLKNEKCSRPLIVTDRGLAQTPIPSEIQKHLSANGLEAAVFSEIWGNPVKTQVGQGVEAFRRHRADSIVAVGGGAAVDVAKAIAVMVNHPGDLFDYEDGKETRAMDQAIPYLAALPTTAGTGSEVGRSTVVSDDQTKIKKIIFSPRLLPRVVFADPELTLALPPAITAATGMDALTHLVEAYLSKGFQPLCDGIALQGVTLVSQSLSPCVHHGDDLYHRGLLLAASMMGAVAFQKGLGVTHSCAHALSTVCDIHHGLANGVLIPYAMRFNLDVCADKFNILAQAADAPQKTAVGFIDWIVGLKRDIKIPDHLSELGVRKDQIKRLVEIALADACHPLNPKPVTAKDFERIFTEAIGA